MRNLRLLILFCLSGSALSGCAQASFIKKGNAFMSERSPGTEMLDDNGNPVVQQKIVNYTVYVELSGAVPEWKYAWYQSQMFVLNPTKIDGGKLEIGIDKTTGKKITIQPAKGNQLWQLELVPTKSSLNNSIKPKGKEVILEGIRQNKTFRYHIPQMIMLQTTDAV
jgi:hypothetical protein